MTMVMIRGSGSGRESWHFQCNAFPDSHAINLPGHPEGELIDSIPGCARWLHTYVQERAVDDLVVVGHSLGGAIALQYALDFPAGLKALILVASGAKLRVHPNTLEDLAHKVATNASFDPMDGYDLIAPDIAAVLAKRRLENGLVARLNDLKACDAFDVIARLGDVRVPVLAICGTNDVMTPSKCTGYLGSGIPNARTLVLEGGTHQVHLEQPNAVNAAIGEFLRDLR